MRRGATTRGMFLPALLLLGAGTALSALQEAPPPQAGTLRVEVPLVNLYVNVMDKRGAILTDIAKEEFEVKENGKVQEVRHFGRETDRPLTMALLFDTSISQEAVLEDERWAAVRFLEEVMRPQDLTVLISFDLNVDLVQDFTAQIELLDAGLKRVRINAPIGVPGTIPQSGPIGTRLYDAIYLASRQKLHEEVGRKAIILLSDGYDAGSTTQQKEALEAAHRANVIIYAIGISAPAQSFEEQSMRSAGAYALKKMAEETGGLAVFPRDEGELLQAFAAISEQLRTQYVISYRPSNAKRDGKFRKIKVKVERKGTRVQVRKGYYALRPEDPVR